MFYKFGRKTVGSYLGEGQPNISGKLKTAISSLQKIGGDKSDLAKMIMGSDCASNGAGGFGGGLIPGGGSGSTTDRFAPNNERLNAPSVLDEITPKSERILGTLFRGLYRQDAVAGPAVDLISTLPWSSWNLEGIDDKSVKKIYSDAMEAIDPESTMPVLSREFLVMGRFCGSLIFDGTKGTFVDVIPHDPAYLKFEEIPVRGFDPKIDVMSNATLRRFLSSNDPRDIEARNAIPDYLRQRLLRGNAPLEPLNTLFIPRKVFPTNYLGTSIYYRILPFYALEKALWNATISSARRRARSITHISAGIENVWEPTGADLNELVTMFMQSEEDPVGAYVVTRNGVEVNEVRPGSDFWRISEEWDMLTNGKMRAMGLNETFLCISGDSLIPTKEKGIIRIDEMSSGKKKIEDINITVGSKYGESRAVKWIYRGHTDTLKIETDYGYSIKCTPEHKIQILDKETDTLKWKEAQNLKLDDILCIPTKKCVRKTKLKLNLPIFKRSDHDFSSIIPKTPKYMNPDLAFILGLIISEGTFRNFEDGDYTRYKFSFSNSDKKLLDKFEKLINKVFGLGVTRDASMKKGTIFYIKDVKTICNKDTYSMVVHNKIVSNWLDYLGLYGDGIKYGKLPSYYKEVPWCILQADEESQLAYLASYMEGDGSIGDKKEIAFHSRSIKNLKQMQIMLASHGIISRLMKKYYRLNLTRDNALLFYNKIEKYVISKKYKHSRSPYTNRKFGIKINGIKDFLKERIVSRNSLGAYFYDDNNKEVFIKSWASIDISRWNIMLYSSYDEGYYNNFLEVLKKISKSKYNEIINIFKLRYFYDNVSSVRKNRKQDVYDLSMSISPRKSQKNDNAPAFIANGLLIHNSGEATYNTMEAALSVFIENIKVFRDDITKRTFNNKIFSNLARAHGFVKRKTVETSHNIRFGSTKTLLEKQRKNSFVFGDGSNDKNKGINKELSVKDAMNIPHGDLLIPEVVWSKSLSPEGDSAYLDILNTMEEKGVPVNLKQWAAAGGVNLEKAIEGLDEDKKLREEIKQKKGDGEEGDGDDMFAGYVPTIANASNLFCFHPQGKRNFFGVTRKQFKKIVKSLLKTEASKRKKILNDHKYVKRELSKVFDGNPIKIEASCYLLNRFRLCKIPIQKDFLEKVSDKITASLTEETTKEQKRRVFQEMNYIPVVSNFDKTIKENEVKTEVGNAISKINSKIKKTTKENSNIYSGM